MEHSIFLAQVLGPSFTIVFFGFLLLGIWDLKLRNKVLDNYGLGYLKGLDRFMRGPWFIFIGSGHYFHSQYLGS